MGWEGVTRGIGSAIFNIGGGVRLSKGLCVFVWLLCLGELRTESSGASLYDVLIYAR